MGRLFSQGGLRAFISGTQGGPSRAQYRGEGCSDLKKQTYLNPRLRSLALRSLRKQAEWWPAGDRQRGPGQGPPGWDLALQGGHGGLLSPPTRPDPCGSVPASCSLGGVWEHRGMGAGGGIEVKTPGSALGSSFSFPLWVPAVPATLCRRGQGTLEGDMNLWKYPNEVSLS